MSEERNAAQISREFDSAAESIFVITFSPAFSAAHPFSTEPTSTPSLTPKNCAGWESTDSASILNTALRQLMNAFGISASLGILGNSNGNASPDRSIHAFGAANLAEPGFAVNI